MSTHGSAKASDKVLKSYWQRIRASQRARVGLTQAGAGCIELGKKTLSLINTL